MKGITLVKLGGSLITDKSTPFTARGDMIKRLCAEIKDAQPMPLVVGHGGGSFPHQSAAKYGTKDGVTNEKSWEGFCVVQNDAAKLNRIVVDALLGAGVNAVSFQPSASCITERGKIRKWNLHVLERMINDGIVPIPYGDVALDRKQGMSIVSTEEILLFLAGKLKAKRIILCGKVDGVFTADPGKDANATLVKEITKKNFPEIRSYLTGSDGTDVTGGMLNKVEQALEMAKKGATVEIINGMKEGLLKRVLAGETGLGTTIK